MYVGIYRGRPEYLFQIRGSRGIDPVGSTVNEYVAVDVDGAEKDRRIVPARGSAAGKR